VKLVGRGHFPSSGEKTLRLSRCRSSKLRGFRFTRGSGRGELATLTGGPTLQYFFAPTREKNTGRFRGQSAAICVGNKRINFSQVFAGQAVGIKEVHDIWLVSFMDYDLGYFVLETRVLEPLENPFGPKVLPMS